MRRDSANLGMAARLPVEGSASLDRVAELFEPWPDEVRGAPCSMAVAEQFAGASDEIAETLATYAEEACEALDDWPDDARTRELRRLLIQLAEEAARDAAKWSALEGRLARLAKKVTTHVHLDEGALISAECEAEILHRT